eukprot:jgi/Tetstr1/429073/TSEL_019037.t1
MFKGEEEVCEVTPHSEAAGPRPVPTFGGKLTVSSLQRNKVVALPVVGTAASPELHNVVGALEHQQMKAGGIINFNTDTVKNLAATRVFLGDNLRRQGQ